MVCILRYKYLLEWSVTGKTSECYIHCTHYSLADLKNTEISGFCLKSQTSKSGTRLLASNIIYVYCISQGSQPAENAAVTACIGQATTKTQ